MDGQATPGPWVALPCKQTPDRGAVYVEGPNGWDHSPVCSTYESDSREENEANARLIAAAPDLLAVCKAMLAVLKTPGSATAGELSVIAMAARKLGATEMLAAIKKAEGK